MAMVRRVVRDESVAPKLEIVEPDVGQGGPRCVRHSIAPARAIVQQPVARIPGQGRPRRKRAYTSGSWAENRAFPERPAQVVREPIDDFGTPAFVVLSIQSVSSDAPVELDEFPVHGECGANLS